jgi:predicted 3-demethylubiquinone-9 3-methyltransferase (glyoxalase superfamily)
MPHLTRKSHFMQKIIPHLWFDKEAREAANFYASVFPNSKVTDSYIIRNTPSGDCDVMSFELWGLEFMSISAGPLFKFNPSVSFMVNFDPLFFEGSADRTQAARESLDTVWGKLTDGGKVLMELGEYPFSKHYGWVQDKYGLSWQLILTNPEGEPRPPIVPSIMFVKENYGKAEEAINFYLSVFKNSKQGSMHKYPAGMEPDKEGAIMFADFMLEDRWIAIMESAHQHNFNFNEAISFMVNCDDQQEIDHYWEKLSAVKEAEQCGWLKDKYGLSWQITPVDLEKMMRSGTQEQIDRVTQAFLPMKKLDIAKIKAAFK